MARPTSYTVKLAARICGLISNGGNLETIPKKPGIPTKTTIRRWMGQYPEFYAAYARAREDRADYRAHRMDVLAKKAETAGKENIQGLRLAWDNERWQAGKEKPRVYGDKTLVAGADGESDPTITVNLNATDRAARIAEILGSAIKLAEKDSGD